YAGGHEGHARTRRRSKPDSDLRVRVLRTSVGEILIGYFAAAARAGLPAKAGMMSRAKRRIFSREPPKLIMTYSTPPARNAANFRAMSSGVPNSAVSSHSLRIFVSSWAAK